MEKTLSEVIAEHSLPPFVFALVIGVPSMILYAIEVAIVIVHTKEFNSAFFYLFLVRALLIWKYLLPISIVTTLILPLPFLVHNFTWGYLFYIWTDFRTGHQTFTIASHQDDGWRLDWLAISDSWFAAVTAIGFLIVCGLLNIATIVAYKWSKRKYEAMRKATGASKSANVMEEEKIEKRLHIYAFVTFLGQLLMCLFLIIIYKCAMVFDPNDPRSTLFLATFNQLGWVSDISSIVIPSWLILWASTLLRQMVMDLVHRIVGLPFKYMWNKVAGIEGMTVTHITTTSLVRRVA
ncbi:hypothetical protein Ddc_18010 [Ditylenchus destructor]|nr:hypothetical protein Ddc_18010 [Ditylenchus destructor]